MASDETQPLARRGRIELLPNEEIIYHLGASDYFPYPEFWQTNDLPHGGTIASSGLTQPPVLAIRMRMLHARASAQVDPLAFVR